MSSMYDDPHRQDIAQTAIRALRQGLGPDFKCYPKDTWWNEIGLINLCRLDLSEPLNDNFAHLDIPESLEKAFQLDRRLRERHHEKVTLLSALKNTCYSFRVPATSFHKSD
ncbi:Hypothetical predicted protein [Pelobates cultripes]|uniref:Uncharacterized protein n=1 Tax=Pelobates cultripes TaxID=61616 RepID=A0AAD1TBV3_PELCU|nr:Hypothetical predicted protein [Pelobates cultripes]